MNNNNLYDFSINSLISDEVEKQPVVIKQPKIRHVNNIKLLAGNTADYKKRTNLSIEEHYKKAKIMKFIRKVGDGFTIAVLKFFKLVKFNQSKALNPPTIVKGIPDTYDNNK